MDMQALVDGMSARWMRERAETQMTLGKLIAALTELPGDTLIDGIEAPHSYRGYYSDLAFEPAAEKVKAADALAMCRAAMGEVFCGYKGGDYVMGALTPVWIATWGNCGKKFMGIGPDGTIETADDE